MHPIVPKPSWIRHKHLYTAFSKHAKTKQLTWIVLEVKMPQAQRESNADQNIKAPWNILQIYCLIQDHHIKKYHHNKKMHVNS